MIHKIIFLLLFSLALESAQLKENTLSKKDIEILEEAKNEFLKSHPNVDIGELMRFFDEDLTKRQKNELPITPLEFLNKVYELYNAKNKTSVDVDFEKYFRKTPPPKKEPKKIKVWEAIQRNLELGRELTPKQKMAAQVLGIDWRRIQQDIRIRQAELNKKIDIFYTKIQALQTLSEFIAKGMEPSFIDKINRLLHKISFGIFGLNNNNIRFDSYDSTNIWAIASAISTDGIASDNNVESAMVFSVIGMSTEGQVDLLSVAYDWIIRRAEADIQSLWQKGYSPALIQDLEKQLTPYRKKGLKLLYAEKQNEITIIQ